MSCQVTETGKGTVYKPVEKFFDQFFSSTKKPGIALLGNFGTGKTSLCKHYAYLLANRYFDKKSNYFLPIYVNLRDIYNFENIEDDLLTLLHTGYESPVTRKGWKQWLMNGSSLIILDGFDEMASKMDKLQIDKNLNSLMKFCGLYNVKIILSCRTHFFKTQVEEQTLGNMLRLYLCDWGSEELIDYISKSLPQKKDSSLELIKSTYNLEELARTPIFLKMITSTIEEIGGYVNQAKLYHIYTNRWIKSQDYRSNLSQDDKQLLMEELAIDMFLNDKPRIKYNELPIRLKNLFNISGYKSLKEFDRDVRTCSFLIRNPEGYYYFVHKSFMEFFMGLRLAKEVKNNNLKNISKKLLSFEITSFFINYFEDDSDVLIRGLLGSSKEYARANFASALGQLNFNDTSFNSLMIAIKTDKSDIVKYCAIDSLFLFSEDIVKEELVKLASQENELGNYCLKNLGVFYEYSPVIELFKKILETEQETERISMILDNIKSYEIVNLLDDLKIFVNKDVWKQDENIKMSLAYAIQSIADLSLAKQIDTIKHSGLTDKNIILIDEIINELKVKFLRMVENEARENKSSGVKRKQNEGKLHNKYGILVDSVQLKTLMEQLYPTAKIKRRRKVHKKK